MPSFQASGIMDSGVSASVAGRTAGDIRRGAAEFNVGAMQNLLNLALSGQAQVQQPMLAQSSQLASQLAGLRAINTTGTQSGTVTRYANPFETIASGVGAGLGMWAGFGGFGKTG
jgi:hypothetical protein